MMAEGRTRIERKGLRKKKERNKKPTHLQKNNNSPSRPIPSILSSPFKGQPPKEKNRWKRNDDKKIEQQKTQND
jgi:hypothetical protein